MCFGDTPAVVPKRITIMKGKMSRGTSLSLSLEMMSQFFHTIALIFLRSRSLSTPFPLWFDFSSISTTLSLPCSAVDKHILQGWLNCSQLADGYPFPLKQVGY